MSNYIRSSNPCYEYNEYDNTCHECSEHDDCKKHNKPCKKIVQAIKFVLLITLITTISLITSLTINSGSNSTIIPYSSGTSGMLLSAHADGSPEQVAFMDFGTASNYSVFTEGDGTEVIDLQSLNILFDNYFIMPRKGTITSIYADFTTQLQEDLSGSDSQVSVGLYAAAPDSRVFRVIPEAVLHLTPKLNGVIPVNTVLNASNDQLSVSVDEGTKLLLVYYISASSGTIAVMQGSGSGGINIK